MENDGKITGVRHDNGITGVDSNNKSAESGSTGATDEVDKLALIDEATTEAERDIAEGTDLLAGTETETEEARNENVIHPALQVPTVEHTYNLRQGKHPRPDYTSRYGFQATIIHCALTQLSMKRGPKKFKKKGENTVTAELEQLHRRDTFRPVRIENLTEKYKHDSLALLMLLKKKRDRLIKGGGVADGRKQREKTEPKDKKSPTVSTEEVMLTAKIDALEGLDMAVVDIPGEYMSVYMEDEVHRVFIGTLAYMMVMANP